jgi:hypothetical protein
MRNVVLAAAILALAAPAVAQERFTIEARPDLDWVTVPVIRPTAPNMPIALDVIPNGKPADRGVYGAAWIHVCDNDIDNGPMNCAMVSAGDRAVRFGSSNFGDEPARPIEFVVGNKVVGTITTQRTIKVGEFDSSEVLRKLDAVLEVNRAQAAEIRSLRSRLQKLERRR